MARSVLGQRKAEVRGAPDTETTARRGVHYFYIPGVTQNSATDQGSRVFVRVVLGCLKWWTPPANFPETPVQMVVRSPHLPFDLFSRRSEGILLSQNRSRDQDDPDLSMNVIGGQPPACAWPVTSNP